MVVYFSFEVGFQGGTDQRANLQIYRDEDRPLYRTGNKILLGLVSFNLVWAIGMKYFYTWRNESKEKVWSGMTREEKNNYLETTKDEGNKRLDFRFAH